MDERRQWVEHDHPYLSVRQQSDILSLQRSGIYYKPRQELLGEGQLGLLAVWQGNSTKFAVP